MRLDQPISERLMREFEPQESWLSHDSYYHGVGHMARVFVLQELICNQLEIQGIEINREALRWAASTHDVGRLDDGLDPGHGARSARWIKDNLSERMSPEILDVATYIVHWHVPPDLDAPVMTVELKVLKDADALDRARLGDLNPNLLRTEPARRMVELAEQLYELSLPDGSFQEKETFASVLKAVRLMGLSKN